MLPPEVHGKWHSFCNQGVYRGCSSYDEQPCLQIVVKKVVFASGNSMIGEGRIGSRCLKWSQSKSKTWAYAQKGRQKLGEIRSFGFQEALWLEGSGELSGIVVSESIDHCQKLAGFRSYCFKDSGWLFEGAVDKAWRPIHQWAKCPKFLCTASYCSLGVNAQSEVATDIRTGLSTVCSL